MYTSYFHQYCINNDIKDDGIALDMNIYAAATKEKDVGQAALLTSLEKLKCKDLIDAEHLSDSDCIRRKRLFASRMQYIRLKSEEDYLSLDGAMRRDVPRIVYLSISPTLYEVVAERVNKYLRSPSHDLRVVFEKPFGKDFSSAQLLSQQLRSRLKEHEIYRVDHYIGKVGMRVLSHRLHSSAPLPRSVDVVMTETEHVGGRSIFYDEYGVVRDVMQNHLTLALVAVLTRGGSACGVYGCLSERLHILERITGADVLMLGQYAGYHTHVAQDFSSSSATTITPTAAAVRFMYRESSGDIVPLRVIAGKALDNRRMFVRVKHDEDCTITYNIQGNNKDSSSTLPKIVLSKECWSLFKGNTSSREELCSDMSDRISIPFGWQYVGSHNCLCYDECILQPVAPIPAPLPYANAYVEVVRGVLVNNTNLFTSTKELLAQWRMWDPVLKHLSRQDLVAQKMVEYTPNYNVLQFMHS